MDDSTLELMEPEASPGATPRSGVRRVNNMPMVIGGAVLAVFLGVMVMVGMDRAEKQNAPVTKKAEQAVAASAFADEITGDQKSGFIPAKAPAMPNFADPSSSAVGAGGPPLPPAAGGSAVPIARPDSAMVGEAPPLPPPSRGAPQMEQRSRRSDDEEATIRRAKMQQAEEALRAKTSAPGARLAGGPGGARSGGAPGSREDALARLAEVRQQLDGASRSDPTASFQQRLDQIRASGLLPAGVGGAAGGGSLGAGGAARGGRNDVAQFAGTGQGDRWRLNTQVEPPRSPYELRAGFVLPATLIAGINSELPGQIQGQVSQDVWDTATGKHKLVPQGTRLVGSYSSETAFGQSRVLVAWQRLVFPDGKVLDIGAMPGSDSAGYAGLSDQVNNHYFRLFGSAILMSAVTAGVSLSQGGAAGSATAPTASSAMSEALGQQLGQVTTQLISKNLNVSPTLEIRPGYRFNVVVVKDLTFTRPYRAFDY